MMDENTESNTDTGGEIEAIRILPRRKNDFVTFRFRRTPFLAVTFVITFGLGLSLGYMMWGGNAGTQTNENQSAQDPQTSTRYEVPIADSDPSQGPEDALITMIEFSDFECPYCQRYFLEVLPRLQARYAGKVRFIFKNFPLTSIHPEAVPAAEAAQCAHEQGLFWEFHDLLFQMRLELGPEAYMSYAEELGLDIDAFSICIEERRYTDVVRADYDFASQLGIRSTPTFFINGIAVQGALAYEEFVSIIDGELENFE